MAMTFPAGAAEPREAEADPIWEAVLARLRLQTSPAHYETYLRGTRAIELDAGACVLRVAVSNPFHVPWLEGAFGSTVHAALGEVLGGQLLRVEFTSDMSATPRVATRAPAQRARPQPLSAAAPGAAAGARPLDALMELRPAPAAPAPGGSRLQGSPLNARYTFDSFVVGQSNQLAHAASMAVGDEPGRAYNPLFLYGGVGLGKTHLLHAIGHCVLAKGLSVVFVSSERFTNDLIDAIRQRTTDEFRATYRRANLLLIDDVQFIAGKERTEEEFFHTFNAVHEAGGQIVLSSDRPPRAMTILEDRLRSRFEWGLIADVQLPDYETRIAILRSKLTGPLAGMVPPAVVEFMAQKVQSNIRELEGSLNRLLAHSRHLKQPLTVDLAQAVLRDLVAQNPAVTGATPEGVLEAVSRYFGVSHADLKGKARHKEIVVPRQVAMYLLREDARISTPDIGRLLNRDHTTVLHGANLVVADVAREGPMRAAVRGVREVLVAASAD